jgi:WD40 repeat protein
MLRLLLTVILATAVTFGIVWYFDLWPAAGSSDRAANAARDLARSQALGKLLYPAEPEPLDRSQGGKRLGPDTIILPDCHIFPVDKQDVASQRDGQLLFIGEEVLKENPNTPGTTLTVTLRVGKREILKTYRRLDRGDIVLPGQLMGLIDPTMAMAELQAVNARRQAAVADQLAAKAILEEADLQVRRLKDARVGTGAGVRAVSDQDLSVAQATAKKTFMELASKGEAIRLAEAEIDKTETALRQHEIRNKMSGAGIVKAVYKHRGDMVRNQEPILQLYSLERLRAEGLADVQYFERLHVGAPVTLEPTVLDPPYTVLPGHRGEVTGVAIVGKGQKLRVISASEDRTVAVWGMSQRGPLRVLYHPEPVRAVACTEVNGRAWCLTGCADGSLRLWDLDGRDSKPYWENKDADQGAHRGAVTALAFSANGAFFATGGDDGMIQICRLDNGKVLYPFDLEHGVDQPHQGAITSLHFTKQCRLVSAGRDNTLRVWTLHEHGAVMDPRVVAGRLGTVPTLGVSPDGGQMLFDQGRRLQVLAVPDGRTLCEMVGTFGATPFETLALFSPDATLILTAGAPEGRLQLWRAPTPASRAFEVRQFATLERSPVTCAAFAPDDGSFAASGTKDGTVYLWQLPSPQSVANQRIRGLRLTLVDRALDANTRQVRIGVDIHNPLDDQHPYGVLSDRLMPGRPVTVVVGE